jgi:glucose/arabinose dehydrogenase
MSFRITVAIIAFGSICLTAPPLNAQRKTGSEPKVAHGAVVAEDQEIGKTFRINPDELPQPKATKAVSNGPLSVPFNGQAPKVPEGFTATLFAKLEHPRRMLVLPNGDIIVAEQKPGHLTLLRAAEDGGKAEFIERYAQDFNQPYGLAWHNDHVLVADQDGIWKVPHKLGDVRTGHRARRPRTSPRRTASLRPTSTPRR